MKKTLLKDYYDIIYPGMIKWANEYYSARVKDIIYASPKIADEYIRGNAKRELQKMLKK